MVSTATSLFTGRDPTSRPTFISFNSFRNKAHSVQLPNSSVVGMVKLEDSKGFKNKIKKSKHCKTLAQINNTEKQKSNCPIHLILETDRLALCTQESVVLTP